ncbi:MAG: actin-binding WH2 domain-containing protein [Sphaerospermopsis sp. SIO1G1]|nr:actin-binding WH2 domain-containing protein [Sphaerospermopsis sp. SIO1G1]
MMENKPVRVKYFGVLIFLLQDREIFLEEIRQGVKLPQKIISLLVCSSIFIAIYGGIIGAYHSWMQALSSAVKLPALFLITLLICLPTLYFSNIIFGSRRSFGQYFALVLTAVSVTSVLLFSFAPITLFFLVTTNNYQFLILLNVLIFGLTGFIGVYSLYYASKIILEQDSQGSDTRNKIIKGWLFLYAFVGSQLGWTLRPFFGAPDSVFQLLREREGNFYLSILQALGYLLGVR